MLRCGAKAVTAQCLSFATTLLHLNENCVNLAGCMWLSQPRMGVRVCERCGCSSAFRHLVSIRFNYHFSTSNYIVTVFTPTRLLADSTETRKTRSTEFNGYNAWVLFSKFLVFAFVFADHAYIDNGRALDCPKNSCATLPPLSPKCGWLIDSAPWWWGSLFGFITWAMT